MLSVGSLEACKAIFKCLQDFLSHGNCLLLFLTKHVQTYQLLEATIAFLGFDQAVDGKANQESKNTALKVLKICPIFIETLQKIYNAQTLEVVE